ncbi:hypothetical protein [Halanaeroarchaeum sulfurireducens]|nr:hypothetical protein [Halanaeroarchaeum sulfurireducens]
MAAPQNDTHPFGGEEYMTVTLATTPRWGIPEDADWVADEMARRSYASPWAVASPKHAAIVRRQGRLEESFVQTVVDALGTYLVPPTEE